LLWFNPRESLLSSVGVVDMVPEMIFKIIATSKAGKEIGIEKL